MIGRVLKESTLPFDDSSSFSTPPAFGPYRVLHQVGSGVLGPVFRTHDPRHDRLIAVKAFTVEVLPERLTPLVEQLRSLTALVADLPGAVTTWEVGVHELTPFLAQSYETGETLDAAMRHLAPAPLDRALAVLAPLARLVDAAWARGCGHGNLHPRDLFLDPSGTIRVSGFGVVQAFERAGIALPIRRVYAAPERSATGWHRRADVYSLGVIAHELLTRRRPIGPGEQDGEFSADVPAAQRVEIRRVLARALALSPDDRYDSALAFIEALGQIGGFQERYEGDERDEGYERDAERAGAGQPFQKPGDDRDDRDDGYDRDVERAGAGQPLQMAGDDRDDGDDRDAERADAGQPIQLGGDGGYDRDDGDAERAGAAPLVHKDGDETGAELEGFYGFDRSNTSLGADRFNGSDRSDRSDGSFGSDRSSGFERFGRSGGDDTDTLLVHDIRHQRPGSYERAELDESAGRELWLRERQGEEAATEQQAPDLFVASSGRSGSGKAAMAALVVLGLLTGGLTTYWLTRGGARTDAGSSAEAVASAPAEAVGETPSEAGSEAAPEAADGEANASPEPVESREADEPAPSVPQAARAANRTGQIAIVSEPSGALVTIDGRLRGSTPLTVAQLPLGVRTVQVARPGYVPRVERVMLSGSATRRSVTVALEPGLGTDAPAAGASAFGAIDVDSRPRGARVLVDGRFVGHSPLRIPELRPGPHLVVLEMAGRTGSGRRVQVMPGQVARVRVDMP